MKAGKLFGFPQRAGMILFGAFLIVLTAIIALRSPLMAQQPPVMLAAPVRPMQPPFTPVPPAAPVYTQDNSVPVETSPVNDIDIQKSINNVFMSDKFLRHFGIHVTAQNGVAILTGTADSWQDYFRAETDAFAAGAQGVDNRLRVRFSY